MLASTISSVAQVYKRFPALAETSSSPLLKLAIRVLNVTYVATRSFEPTHVLRLHPIISALTPDYETYPRMAFVPQCLRVYLCSKSYLID